MFKSLAICVCWFSFPLTPIPTGLIKGITSAHAYGFTLQSCQQREGVFTICWPRSFCTACGSAWAPFYQAGVTYGSKRHLVDISYTAKELFSVLNISSVSRAKSCLSITAIHIGSNSRGYQNIVNLFSLQPFSLGTFRP